MKYIYKDVLFAALFGKIEELDVDAIALPTTPTLLMDSGITAKIKAVAGQAIEDEAVMQAPGKQGDAILTGSGDLPLKNIFHCVMLDATKNASPENLRISISTVFKKAGKLGLKKLAFPAVGASFPGLDPKTTTEIIVDEAKKSIPDKEGVFSEVCFIVCDSTPYVYYKKALKKNFKKSQIQLTNSNIKP